MAVIRRLYVGRNQGAKIAEKELKKYSIEHVIIESDDETTEPVLVTPEGYFEGIEQIKEYVRYWAQISRYGSKVKRSIYVF